MIAFKLIYDLRSTQIDVSINQNCDRFKIILFISLIFKNIMQDLRYDENDDEANDNFDDYQKRARQLLINTTKEEFRRQSLERAELSFFNSESSVSGFVLHRWLDLIPIMDGSSFRRLRRVISSRDHQKGL